ncbi:MAG: protein kinase [Melioribacteraceae bacterium]|nr:protein kinase [Melioribacteraceae bacterium]
MINKRFNIINKIGEGRSPVFLCEDKNIPGKKYAIKILKSSSEEDELQSFKDEYYLLKNLDHPNIIKAYDYGTVLSLSNEARKSGIAPGDKFILLEYFNGNELLHYSGPDDIEIQKIILQISSVLFYLHQSNYIYFDLKPENILVEGKGADINLKFIDFGFARYLSALEDNVIRGTKEYLAPELIKKEPVDHRADLYSFGILLYRIILGKFPFPTDKEIDIYKAHVSEEFKIPEFKFKIPLKKAVEKLLSKKASDRYYTSLQLLADLGIRFDGVSRTWKVIPSLVENAEVNSDLKTYLGKSSNGKILLVKGNPGTGKSTLLNNLERNTDNFIQLNENEAPTGTNFARYVLDKITSNEEVYKILDESILQYIDLHIKDNSKDLIGEFKSIISKISGKIKFILAVDDYDQLSPLSSEIMESIFPILQSNNIHVVLSGKFEQTPNLSNILEILMPVFTKSDVEQFVDKSYSAFYPKEELISLIVQYADLIPGHIIDFIAKLNFANLLEYTAEGPVIQVSEENLSDITSATEKVYKNQLDKLETEELHYLKLISSFNDALDISIVSQLLNVGIQKLELMNENLERNNLLIRSNLNPKPTISSASLKSYIYNLIQNRKKHHSELADKLISLNKEFLNKEVAFHLTKSERFLESYKYYLKQIENAELLSALTTEKKLLETVQEYDLPPEIKLEIQINLSDVLFRLGNFQECLNKTSDLIQQISDTSDKTKLLIQKASCLMQVGKLEDSAEILEELNQSDLSEGIRNKVSYELASTYLELSKYDSTQAFCNKIIENEKSNYFEKGKAYNLLALVNFYEENNLEGSLSKFKESLECYEKSNNIVQVAAAELNIGNIYYLMGKEEDARIHWNKSLQINQSTGNVEQEAKILMSSGISDVRQAEFEKAIEKYGRAVNIFRGISSRKGLGLALANLAEAYVEICEYSNALEMLDEAESIFKSLNNLDELLEVYYHKVRLYYRLNSIEECNTISKILDKLLISNSTKERYTVLKKSVLLLLNKMKGEEIAVEALDEMLAHYRSENDSINYPIFAEIKFAKLVEEFKYDEAFKYVECDEFNSMIKSNLAIAFKNILLAQLAKRNISAELDPEILYLNRAFDSIENESITLLTFTVIYNLCEYYLQRGNTKKAQSYVKYFNSIHEFIQGNINSVKLQNSFNRSEFIVNAQAAIKKVF